MTCTDTVEEIATNAYKDALEIHQLIQMLEVQNSAGVNDNLVAKGANNAAFAIRNSLITRLVLLVSRAYGLTRDGDLHLQKGFELLQRNKQVRSVFDGSKVKAAEDFWGRCKGDHRRPKLQHFRDKFTAHLGEPEDIELPAYKELFDFAIMTATAMEKFAFAAGVANVPVSEQVDAKSVARNFWAPWGKFD
jgi:hypothetical protein